MSKVLIISRREFFRLRSRFTGRTRLFVLGIIAVAAILSSVIYHQGPIISKALYDIGVAPGGPSVADQRFNVLSTADQSGAALLAKKDIDLCISPDGVVARDDDKSQYTLGAFKQYIEKDELVRVFDEYQDRLDQAFPLRIEVHHLDQNPEPGEDAGTTLASAAMSEPDNPNDDDPTVSEPPPQTGTPADPDPSASQDPGPPAPPSNGSQSATDDAVRQQLQQFRDEGILPDFKAEFASEDEIIVPSLMTPPVPFAQVLLAFFYIVPTFLLSVFFTSSFMEEKTNRKLVILLSAPITPLQIILGKMLPYIGYSIIAIVGITLILGGNVGYGLAIFLPIVLFILSIYLMVALLYRTFKDQTFFSLMAVWIVTAYLVAPAMFTGVNDLAFISPLTLAVLMYRGESFTVAQYFLSTLPMYAIFAVTMYVAVRILNEEYLMGYRPLYRKLSEAVALVINTSHMGISVLLLSFICIPIAFMVQFATIVLAYNLSESVGLGVVFVVAIIIEEIVKSTGIIVLVQNGHISTSRSLVKLAIMSALGFWIGEKLLLYLALSVISETMFTDAVSNSGFLLLPLANHVISTMVVIFVTKRLGLRYFPIGILAGSLVHGAYNMGVIHFLSGGTP